jgi:phage tail-like protein
MTNQSQEESNKSEMFYFLLLFDEMQIPFQEASGIESEIDPVEYRSGDNKYFNKINLPKTGNKSSVTLKRGLTANSSSLTNWFNTEGTPIRKTVNINLCDGSGNVVMSWKLQNAFPVQLLTADLRSDSGQVVVDVFELAHDGWNVVGK